MNKLQTLIEQALYETNEYGITHQKTEYKIEEELLAKVTDVFDLNEDTHKTCIACQMRQIKKYGRNNIKCNFIPRSIPINKQVIKDIADKTEVSLDHAKKILLSTIDPVAWCELMFGFSDKDAKWKLRSYQKEQLRCSSKRYTIREGRRSGKSFAMALKLVYYAFNMKVKAGRDAQGVEVSTGPSIMIVTPYQAQLTNLFEEMEKLLKRNIELKQEIITGTGDSLYVKTPTFKMEFRNGALIQGFVSGIGMRQDGSGGGTMRGKSADVVYLDEMDMIPEEILDKVIMPILATTPDTMLLATSTPIGKKGKFHNWCLERDDFKEDYLPSTVIPHWEQIKEEILRDATRESFYAEYMAEFIDDEAGIFKVEWIQNARVDYLYEDTSNLSLLARKFGFERISKPIVAIGIDWNKNAGTEYYVSGYFPEYGMWIGLDSVNVPASEFSAKRWIKELVNLNYRWKPSYIYADEGYGHTIIEDVKFEAYRLRGKKNKTPIDEETVLIPDRLTSFNFSKNVLLKDPVTNEDIKKNAKHFLVENVVRLLQEGLFKFSVEDERLKEQLRNYKLVRRNASTNSPVYGQVNKNVGDHRLDAMMLSLGALVLEESVYSGKQLEISVPSFIKMKRGDDYESPWEETDRILGDMQDGGFGGQVNVLQIVRGGGSPEEDRMIKEKYREQGTWESPNKSRNMYKEQDKISLLEGFNKYLGTSKSSERIGEIYTTRRRGKFGSKSRSWRR